MPYGLSEKYLAELREIFASIPQIETVVLYGSRARGDYHDRSDIDLSLKGEGLTSHHLALFEDCYYHSKIPYLHDANLYDAIRSADFKMSIDRDGVVIYRRAT